MPTIDSYPRATELIDDSVLYLVMNKTDTSLELNRLKEYILEGRKLTDNEIQALFQETGG